MLLDDRTAMIGSGFLGFDLTDAFDCQMYAFDAGDEGWIVVDAGAGRDVDAVLAIFGAPVELEDHASAALAAARAMAARLAVEVPEVGAGIGVATGQVVAGNVGHEQRFEYTVIGDAVNSAARLTDLAKDVPGCVLASWDTVEQAGAPEAGAWVPHGETTLRGRSAPTRLAVPRS